jgi:hypothetical protein
VSNYLKTNVINEAITSLNLVRESLHVVETDVYRWKWIIIALHNALQNTMVSALRQGNGFHAMNNDSVKQWMEAYQIDEPLPPLKLANFLELYKRIKKKEIMESYVFSKRFVANQEHTNSVKKLNYLRNRFIHFELDIWSLEIVTMPDLCLHCLDVISFLVFESGNIILTAENEGEKLKSLLLDAIELLKHFNKNIK